MHSEGETCAGLLYFLDTGAYMPKKGLLGCFHSINLNWNIRIGSNRRKGGKKPAVVFFHKVSSLNPGYLPHRLLMVQA
jgi:hypothetical protein